MSRRRRLAFALAALLAGALVWGAGPAAAYWTTTGAGAGDAGTSDLSPPAIDAPGASAGMTTITWTDQAELSDDPSAGTVTYVVQRSLGGGAYAAISSGDCAGPIARPATSCTDAGVATGSYSYRVVASLATWTAVSNAVAVSVNTDTSHPTASITRITASPTNLASVGWRVSFSEPVTGVDATDFTLIAGGAVSGAAITSVTGSSATYTVTANAGSGDGTIGLNLVDDDSILDAEVRPLGGAGAGNGNVTGPADTIDRTAPALTTLQMLDTNADGKVNAIRATFSESVASTTLKTNWALTDVPSGGSLSSVARSGAIVTLTLTQGAGPADTGVGLFKIGLAAAATGVRDAAGNQASFAARAPADAARPVLVGVTDTDVGTDGLIEQGDSMSFSFSEAIRPSSVVAAPKVTIARPATGNATLAIPSVLSTTTGMGSPDYLNTAGKSAVFNGTAAANGAIVTVTVGACTAGCSYPSAPAAAPTMSIRPSTALTDLLGNTGASTAYTLAATRLF